MKFRGGDFTEVGLLGLILIASSIDAAEPLPKLRDVEIKSSLDHTEQPAKIWTPASAGKQPTPLLVFLHSWSGDLRQNNSPWLKEAVARGWIFLHPNFRGRNDHPQACGSRLARQDILDAIDFAAQDFNVDRSRIYLAGTSGGGHMAMLMAGYHPERFSAVSAWVGISDLAAWYRFHVKNGKPQRYAQMVAKCCGGAPGSSPEVDQEYQARSPRFHLQNTGKLPIDLYSGLHDGHTGSVPVRHTLDAFNVIAKAGKHAEIAEADIQSLLQESPLKSPQPSDTAVDKTLGRKIHLRRTAGAARVTIFEGGHEGLPGPACAWLEKQRRPTKPGK